MSGTSIYFPTKKINTVTLTGSGNFTVPGGVTRLELEMYGAGGGGAVVFESSGPEGMATGGKAGKQTKFTLSVTPNQVISYSCGVGGSPGGVNAFGSNGGNTTFGSLQSPGGQGGFMIQNSLTVFYQPPGSDGYVSGAIGGSSQNSGNLSFGGGEGGIGNGGNGNGGIHTAGIAAGGGAGVRTNSGTSFAGTGGNGIIYVKYTAPIS